MFFKKFTEPEKIKKFIDTLLKTDNLLESKEGLLNGKKEGLQAAYNYKLEQRDYAWVDKMIQEFKQPPDAQVLNVTMTKELVRGEIPDLLLQIFLRCRQKFELGAETIRHLRNIDLRSAAIITDIGLPKDKKERDLAVKELCRDHLLETVPDC